MTYVHGNTKTLYFFTKIIAECKKCLISKEMESRIKI